MQKYAFFSDLENASVPYFQKKTLRNHYHTVNTCVSKGKQLILSSFQLWVIHKNMPTNGKTDNNFKLFSYLCSVRIVRTRIS